jgi:uncharacterized protein involved in cysteine biosynthesis
VALMLLLTALVSLGLDWVAPSWLPGLGILFATLGVLAGLALSWLLFPALTAAVMALLAEPIARAVEARHYPDAPPPRPQSMGEMAVGAAKLALVAIIVNLLALPAYLLLPALNLIIYLIANGYLVGWGYFEAAAARRFDPAQQRLEWRRQRLGLWGAGAGLSFLLTIPIVNLAAPLVAIATMVHVVERMRHRQTAK